MTHKTLIKISLLLVLMLTGPLSAAYAQKGAAMKGMVRDEFGKPLVGVAICSANGNNRSVTQKDGSYSIRRSTTAATGSYSPIWDMPTKAFPTGKAPTST